MSISRIQFRLIRAAILSLVDNNLLSKDQADAITAAISDKIKVEATSK